MCLFPGLRICQSFSNILIGSVIRLFFLIFIILDHVVPFAAPPSTFSMLLPVPRFPVQVFFGKCVVCGLSAECPCSAFDIPPQLVMKKHVKIRTGHQHFLQQVDKDVSSDPLSCYIQTGDYILLYSGSILLFQDAERPAFLCSQTDNTVSMYPVLFAIS